MTPGGSCGAADADSLCGKSASAADMPELPNQARCGVGAAPPYSARAVPPRPQFAKLRVPARWSIMLDALLRPVGSYCPAGAPQPALLVEFVEIERQLDLGAALGRQ